MNRYCDFSKDIDKRRLFRAHQWMYSLIYPSALGSLAVSLAAASSIRELLNFHFLFALFIALYFALQHVQNAVDLQSYSWPSFWSDIAEVVLIFTFYINLGLFDGATFGGSEDNNSKVVALPKLLYFLFATGFLLPVLARFCTIGWPYDKGKNIPLRERTLTTLSLFAFATAFTLAVIVKSDCAAGWPKYITLAILYLIVIIYVIFIVFEFSKNHEQSDLVLPSK